MVPRKRQRSDEACSVLTPLPRTLPADLLLAIAARSDGTTLIRCAATCRFLRRRILTAALVDQQVFTPQGQGVLARLHPRRLKRKHRRRRKPLVSLVYPATPAASSLVGKHLAPFVSRRAADLLWQYDPVTSRRGLVVLRRRRSRRHLRTRERSSSDLCVYDPMTDVRTFLSEPLDVCMDAGKSFITSCVLLTAADGIGCPFLLLVANMNIHPTDSTMSVQTSAPSAAGDISWGPVTEYVCHSGSFEPYNGTVVLPGGVIHWITRDEKILTYDVRTGKLGTVKYPRVLVPGEHHLAVSPDGRLRILAVEEFMISVWEQLSAGGWSPGATIDTEEKLKSMYPKHFIDGADLRCWEEIRSNVVLLQISDRTTVLLDLETKEMRKQEVTTSQFFFELDLLARLQAMRMFS